MIREIVKDEKILTQKSANFIFGEDEHLIEDMLDTANAHKDRCVGLACIQIGIAKRIILVKLNGKFIPFINPVIIQKSPKTFLTQEGCLSLDGIRPVKRHRSVKVMYSTQQGERKIKEFCGFTAQIFQHECDHLNGVLI